MKNLDAAEAAALAKCHPDHMRRLMKARLAPGTKIGKRWIVPEEILQEWINNRCVTIDFRSHHFDVPFFATPFKSDTASKLAVRLAAQRAKRIEQRPKNTKRSSNGG